MRSLPHCRNCGSDNVGPYYCEDCEFDGIAVSASAADDFEDDEGECPSNRRGHSWVENGDEQHHGEGRVYCEFCGADGDA